MKTFFTITLFSISLAFCAAQNTHPYIEAFQDLAMHEMDRTGIPASITLAQGIIESAWGKGVLARSSNNHFGIKCKQEWAGQAFHLEDDDFDSEGNLVKSCFRAYEDAAASYLDHSDFLKKGKRYASLFDLDPTDYVSWARGLQAAGYATDPEYANKLINKIEEYQLYRFDYGEEIVLEDLEKTGVIKSLVNSASTIVETEVMEAPAYTLPSELSDEKISTIEIIESQDLVIPSGQANRLPEVNTPDLNTAPIIEKENTSKRKRMTLHGSFGEL